jgi:hypothetical protein
MMDTEALVFVVDDGDHRLSDRPAQPHGSQAF